MSFKSEVRSLLVVARRAGCEVRRDGAGHWKVTCPGGERLSVAYTPSDWRSVKNFKAALRRAGVLPRPQKRGAGAS